MRRSLTPRIFGMLALIIGGSVLLAAFAARLAPLQEEAQVSSQPPVDESDIKNYAGNEACRSCHPAEFADHQASNHFKALHPMTRADLGALCPAPGRINDSPYSLLEKEGKFYFEVNVPGAQDKYQTWPLDYAFGSGKTGLTFVSMLEGRNIVEMKLSYFPSTRAWRVTPGQDLDHPTSAGRTRDLNQSRRCFGCHTVAVSHNAFTPRQSLLGVGCESCHGPGKAHIEAVRSGAADRQMERMGALSARELNMRCGACHSTEEDVSHAVSALSAKMTYRFPPYALMQSRCFKESSNGPSCLSCHNPHRNDAAAPQVYEKACLACHSPDRSHAGRPGAGAETGKVCPVSPRGGCIRCHMPKRDLKFVTHETSGILMTEHKIAVYPDVR